MLKRRSFRNDMLLIGLFIIIAAISFFIINLTKSDETNMVVQITIDGELVEAFPLKKEKDYNIQKELECGTMLIIKDGYVYLKYATCPDKLCEKQGKISKTGQAIICLPYKLVVTIISDENNENSTGEVDVLQ